MSNVEEVLSRCRKCKQYNPTRIEGFRYIEAFEPGEKVAFDIIVPFEGKYIATVIDYFSRYAFAKVLNTRSSEMILKFL